MNTKHVLLPIILAFASIMPLFGQNDHIKPAAMERTMGKPTLSATVEGISLKVWLVTQKQHDRIMKRIIMQMRTKGMKDTSMGMDKATRKSMMAGTHHLMLVVVDPASGKEIDNASARVLIVSPTKKSSSIELIPIMGHYGDGLKLEEKGAYQITVIVKIDGVPKSKQFQYTVK